MKTVDSTVLVSPPTGELRLTLALNRFGAHRPVEQAFIIASRLGDGIFWYALLAAIITFGGSEGSRAALHMSVVGLFVAGLYRTMKNVVRRPRPCHRHDAIVARVRPLDEFSFPSGHTLHAVTFSMIAIGYFPVLAWLLVPASLLIAASRVILGVHYPSDVLAAISLGCVIALASFVLAG